MSVNVEETLSRISNHKGVEGVIVCTADGTPLRPSPGMSDELTNKYTSNLSELINKARSAIRDIEPTDDLTFIRIRSKNHEIMIAPDKEYLLIVVQNPTVASSKS